MKNIFQKLFPVWLLAVASLLSSCRFGVFAGEKKLGELEITSGAAYDFGLIFINASSDQTITLHNRRKGVASQLALDLSQATPFGYKGGAFPGTGGTCDETIAEDETCTLVLSYSPTASGAHTFEGTIGYFDGELTNTLSISLAGSAQTHASLTFDVGALYDFGSVGVTSTATATLTITNGGQVAATSLTPAAPALGGRFTYLDGTFPGTGGTCTATIDAATSCTVIITYTPTATVLSTSAIFLSYETGEGTASLSVDVQGTGVLASLAITDSPFFDYSNVNIGSSSDHTFTITNVGGLAATDIALGTPQLASPYLFKNGAYPGTGGTCGTTLAAGAGCTIVVTYAPIDIGTTTDTIRLIYNDGQAIQPLARQVRGVAVSKANLVISDAPSFSFGTVPINSSNDKTFTVINSGALDATSFGEDATTLTSPYQFKGGSYPGTGGTCGTTLTGGSSCTVVVTFAPTSSGSASDNLRLTYHDSVVTKVAIRPLSGTTTGTATLVFTETPSLSFGTIALGSTTEQTIHLTNSGGVSATAIGQALALSSPFTYKGGTFPGTGGTCGASLIAGATCTLIVEFSPSVSTAFSDAVLVTYNNGATVQTASLPVTGTGSLASLSLSDGPSFSFGALTVSTTNPKSFTVTNAGGVTATGMAAGSPALAAPYGFAGGSYPGTGGTCGATLAASSSCDIVINYIPSVTGTTSDTVRIGYNDGQSAQIATRLVTGTAVTTASLALSDGPTFDFGSQLTTTSTTKTFTLTNSGGSTATALAVDSDTLTAPYSYLGGTYPGTGGTCGTSLAGSSSCTVVVSYAPTTGGVVSDSIRLTYHNGIAAAELVSVDVTGTGILPASLSFSDGPTFDFSGVFVGSTLDHTFTVTNDGQVDATTVAEATPAIGAPFSYTGGAFPGTGGDCGATIAAGTSCTIVVTFSPSALGAASDTLGLTYHDGLLAGRSATRPITGTGVLASIAFDSSATVDFGDIALGAAPVATLTLTNSGGGTATLVGPGAPALAAPFAYPGSGYPGTGGTCGVSLAAGASCTIKIQFTPTTLGVVNDTIRITYFDGQGTQSTTRDVTGVGVDGLLTISDGPTFDFGSAFVSTSVDKTFTVTNSGSGSATGVSEALPNIAAPFRFKDGSFPGTGGTCTGTILASASCTIVVTFTPTSTAVSSTTIHLGYTDGTNSLEATRAITGTGLSVASLIISDGPSFSFGGVYKNSSTDKTFTITNTGGSSATAVASGLPAIAAPFAFKGGSYPGTGGTCTATIAAAGSCMVIVTYNPTAAGSFSSVLSLGYNDGLNSNTAVRVLSGTSVDPAVLTISNGPVFSFGSVNVGSSSTKSFTLSNTGAVAATLLAAGTPALAAPFNFLGGGFPGTGGTCTATLNTASSCTFVVEYTPAGAGTFFDTVNLSFNDGLNVVSASRDIHGSSTGRGELSLAFGAGLGGTRTLMSLGMVTARRAAAGRAVAVQPDGRIVVAGYGQSEQGRDVFTIMRFEEDGSLDVTFGTRGITLLSFGAVGDRAHAVALQPDGKIVVAGYSARTSNDVDFAVARLSVDGQPDDSFGAHGKKIVAVSAGDDRAHALVVMPDGRIAVGGYGAGDFALAILQGNGTTENIFTADLGGDDRAYAMARDARGKILLGGRNGSRAAWIRLSEDGTWEGPARLAEGTTIFGMAVTSSGEIWGVGDTGAGGFAASWDERGRRLRNVAAPAALRSLAVLANQSIAVAGTDAGRFALGMLSPEGAWDLGFGNRGWSLWKDGESAAYGVAVDPRGRLLTVGHSTVDGLSRFAIARFVN